METVAELLAASDDLVTTVRDALRRDDKRYTLAEAAEAAGISVDGLRRINLASGFADPGPDARIVTEEDIEVLRLL